MKFQWDLTQHLLLPTYRQQMRPDLRRAGRFGYMFRSIDDLAVQNDGGGGFKIYKDIYPLALELTKENSTTQEESFLDLYLKVSVR